MHPRHERMGAFDAVMYDIEGDPLLRSAIVSFIVLDKAPDRQRLVERTERLTRKFPRLRQRAVGNPFSPAPPRWETDPNFDPAYHVRWRRLDESEADLGGALVYAARLGDGDFDHSRPLWEMSVLTGLDGGRAAVIFKVHHSVADGMGSVAMSASFFDLTPEEPDLGPLPPAPKADPAGLVDRVRQATQFEIGALGEVAVGSAKAYVRSVRSLVTNPIGSLTTTWRTASSAAALLAPQSEPLSTWMVGRSLTSAFTLLDVPLDKLKAAAHEAGVTLNIVFIAAVADAIGTYHRQHDHPIDGFRINMPVSQREPGDDATGNHWVPARFIVPCGEKGPTTRLKQLVDVVDTARNDPALGLAEGTYKVMALLPAPATERLAGMMMKGVDVAATNVPGPPFPVYLAGAQVTTLVPFAPKSGAAINIALLTYNGTANFGINVDPAAVPDPDEFTACLAASLAKYAED